MLIAFLDLVNFPPLLRNRPKNKGSSTSLSEGDFKAVSLKTKLFDSLYLCTFSSLQYRTQNEDWIKHLSYLFSSFGGSFLVTVKRWGQGITTYVSVVTLHISFYGNKVKTKITESTDDISNLLRSVLATSGQNQCNCTYVSAWDFKAVNLRKYLFILVGDT